MKRMMDRRLQSSLNNSKTLLTVTTVDQSKDWTEIIKLYQKDNVYLAEAAQMLSRNVNYEIPSLKKQIAKCSQMQQEYTRKEIENNRCSQEMKEKFSSSCKQLGIEGKKVKKEIKELVKNLPKSIAEIVKMTCGLQTEIQYYTDFVSFVQANPNSGKDCLSLIRYIIEKGNTTVYEWRTGHAPLHFDNVRPDLEASDEEDENDKKVDEIDWGNLDLNTSDIGTSHDTGDIIYQVDADIDWSLADVPTEEFEIEVVDDPGSLENSAKSEIDPAAVARGTDALTLLDNVETRNTFIDELSELEAFFIQRIVEISSDDGKNILSTTMFQMAPQSLHVDQTKVESMLNRVQAVIGQLTNPKMTDLFLIQSFPSYVHRLVENLKKILSDAEKMASISRLMVLRREEAIAEQIQTEPKLDAIRQKTKELQKQIEQEISVKYKKRRVNIMGEINTI